MAYTFKVDGVPWTPIGGGVEVDDQVEARTTARFGLLVPVGTSFVKGQKVELRDGAGALVFGGRIEVPTRSRYGLPGTQLRYDLACVDDHYLTDKIIVAKSWVGQTCGYMVKDLLASYLRAEGIVGAAYAAEVLADAPIAYWRLGEASGPLADSSVGTAHPLTAAAGLSYGYAGALTSDADKAVLLASGYATSTLTPTATAFTMEAWVNHNGAAWSGTYEMLVSSGGGMPTYMSITNGVVQVSAYLGAAQRQIGSPTVVPATGWHHVAATWDGTTIRLYVDGAEVTNATPTGGATGWGALRIGTFDNATFFYNGYLDEVAVYDQALPPARVKAHYDCGFLPSSVEDGPVVTEVVHNYIYASKSLDELAALANFTWWIFDRRLYFRAYSSTPAPWALTPADVLANPPPKRDEAAPLYRNRQYVKGFKDITSVLLETQHGDGIARAFVMGYPVAKVPVSIAEQRASYSAMVLRDAPLAYWRMADASGLPTDATGNGYTAQAAPNLGYSAATAIAGDVADKSNSFNGASSGVTIGVASAFAFPGGPQTFECWIKCAVLSGNQLFLNNEVVATSAGWRFFVQATGVVSVERRPTSSNVLSGGVYSPAGSVVAGVWAHVVLTYDGAVMNLYVNGILAATAPDAVAWAATTPGFWIGSLGNVSNWWNGWIDEVAVYTKPLSPQQVAAHYAVGSQGIAGAGYAQQVLRDTPSGYWRLGDTGPYADSAPGAAHGGTKVGGIAPAPGVIVGDLDGAIAPDGSTGYITTAGTFTLGTGTALECWVKTVSNGQQPVISNRSGGATYFGVSGGVVFAYNVASVPASVVSTRRVDDGLWHHVVWSLAGGLSSIYIDGVLDSQVAQTIAAGTGAVWIGHDAADWWNGSLDEVAVYLHPLSAAQVAAHYARGRNGGFAAKTWGIKGLDVGKDWYWAKGDPSIVQDPAASPLLVGDSLAVTYQGLFEGITVSEDTAAVSAQRLVEGVGTGYVDAVIDLPNATSHQSALDQAGKLLSMYAKLCNKFRFSTRRTGLAAGQLLTANVSDMGYAGDGLLVTQVKVLDTATLVGGVPALEYEVEAVEGPYNGSWAKFFERLVRPVGVPVQGAGLQAGLTLLASITEPWTWTETVTPTVRACFAADGATVADGTHLPC